MFALRAAGRTVEILSDVGRGVPDLLVLSPRGQVYLLEVKRPGEKLTPTEEEWHRKWARTSLTGALRIVTTPQEAIEATR